MIISYLQGGLGNQLFQYAAGFVLAKQRQTPLALDLSWYRKNQTDTKREFLLHHYQISARVLPSWQSSLLYGERMLSCRLGKRMFHRYYDEKKFGYDENFFDLPDNAYLKGFYASYRYFNQHIPELQQELSLLHLPSNKNRKIAAEMNDGSVSIHIRRGDYAHNAKTKTFHGLLGNDYYEKAVKRIASMVSLPAYYVFSDEVAWVKDHMRLPKESVFVDWNNNREVDELWLMSRCSHHIIANSTFSWWGAWLNPNPQKIVFTPKQWFGDPTIDTSDLIPPDWMRI
jgi:hypothetical protein